MTVRWHDRVLRHSLRLIDLTGGRVSPRVRAVCRYGVSLVDSGAAAEFRALVRQRLRKAVSRTQAPRLRRPDAASISLDVRHQWLQPDGTVVAKPCWSRGGDGASLTASVVIPCFNYGRYLPEAIASVRAQTLGDVEVIVVDDGSTDEETRGCLDALEREGGVRVVRQANRGLSAARNAGLAVARGEYACCLDADDRLDPTYLEQAVALLESDRSVGFVGSWVRFFGDESALWQTRDFDASQALVGNFTSVASVFRRDDWAMVGGYTETMRDGFEDWEFWIRLAATGRRGLSIARPLLHHRRHGRNMTDTAKARELEVRAQMRSIFPAFYQDGGVRERVDRLTAQPDHTALALTAAAGTADSRRRLLVVVTGLLDGGAHTLLADIIEGLDPAWRPTIVTTGPGPHALEPACARVTTDIVHLDGFLPAERWPWFIDHLVRSRRIDAVISSDCRWHLEQLPRLRSAYPTLALLDLTHNHVPTATLREAMARSSALDRHVVVSQDAARALYEAGVPCTRVTHLANGVDPVRFSPDAVGREDASRRFDATCARVPCTEQGAAAPVRLLWVGRLDPVKRPTLFIDVIAALREKGFDATGLMIGDGPLASDVDRHARRMHIDDAVARLPHMPRADLPAFYIAADLLVLTSAVEGMPLVVLEALACGCPVAATAVGDVTQVLVPGVNGLVLDRDQSDAWGSQIATFLRTDRARGAAREAAAASVRTGAFTMPALATRWRALLDEVVDARRRQ